MEKEPNLAPTFGSSPGRCKPFIWRYYRRFEVRLGNFAAVTGGTKQGR